MQKKKLAKKIKENIMNTIMSESSALIIKSAFGIKFNLSYIIPILLTLIL